MSKIDYNMLSPATQAELARWREETLRGTITQEELKAAINALRGDRTSAIHAAAAGAKGTKRAKKPSTSLSEEDAAKLMEGF